MTCLALYGDPVEDFVVDKFTELLAEVTTNLTRVPARVIPVVPGTSVAWDDCEKGQLTGRLVSMTPVSNVPSQRCGVDYWRATGELMLLRCALAVDDQGRAPKPGDLKAEAAESLADTEVLLKAVIAMPWIDQIASWAPLGPEGGCKGVQVTFTFKLDQPA